MSSRCCARSDSPPVSLPVNLTRRLRRSDSEPRLPAPCRSLSTRPSLDRKSSGARSMQRPARSTWDAARARSRHAKSAGPIRTRASDLRSDAISNAHMRHRTLTPGRRRRRLARTPRNAHASPNVRAAARRPASSETKLASHISDRVCGAPQTVVLPRRDHRDESASDARAAHD